MNLYTEIRQRALQRERSDDIAIEIGDRQISYANLMRDVEYFAALLQEKGLMDRDRVAVVCQNSVELIVATLGAMNAGCVAVPIGNDTSQQRREYILNVTGAALVVFGQEEHSAISSSQAWALDCTEDEPRIEFGVSTASPPSKTQVDAEIGMLLFSSGSTGRPKGVMLRNAGLVWTASTLAEVYRFRPDHRELIVVSLAHSDGWQRSMATLLVGGTVLISTSRIPAATVAREVQDRRAHGFFAPPPIIRRLLRVKPEMLASCRSIEIGSARIERAELEAFLEMVPQADVFFHYGLTECSRAIVLDARRSNSKLDSVGVPLPGVSLGFDEDSEGRLGQILLSGPQLAAGYWGQPELTAETFEGGWLHTGDYGRVDDDGYLYFHGRKDDLITASGHHFFPAEVEMELGQIDGTHSLLVAGVDDPRGISGQVVVAYVVPNDASTFDQRQFIASAKDRLPAHMVPRSVVVVPDLVLTSSHKPDRRATVAKYGTPP